MQTNTQVKKGKKSDKIALTIICIICTLLIVIVATLGYFYAQISSTNIYKGISINGIDVGAMTQSEALSKLEAAGIGADKSFTVTIGDKTRKVSFSEAEATVDLNAAVQYAYSHGRKGDMFDRFATIIGTKFGGIEFSAPFSYNDDASKKIASEISDAVNTQFKESSYSIAKDSLILDIGCEGKGVDAQQIYAGMVENFKSGEARNLTFEEQTTMPKPLDLKAIKEEIDCKPQDAILNNDDLLKPFVVPEVNGVELDLELAEKMLKGEGTGPNGALYTIPLSIVKPKITSADVDFREPFADTLASVSTKLNAGNKPRTNNVKLACKFVNGKILMPGEEFSFNDVVGERTYKRGFQDAKIYVSGEVVDGVGGGICQVSSSIYMAALRSDLEISSRRNHRFTVDYAPLGEDATVVYGQVDFKFKNDTDYPIRIDCALNSNKVDVTIKGNQVTKNKEVKLDTKVLEKKPFQTIKQYDASLAAGKTTVKNGGYTGYKTETYRVVYVDGKEISREFENKSTYTRLDKVVLSGTDPNAPPVVNVPDGGDSGTENPNEIPEWLRPTQSGNASTASPVWIN